LRTLVTELELLRQHAEVLFDLDDRGRLAAVNEPDGDPPPRLFLARGSDAYLLVFGPAVPGPTIRACEDIARELPTWDGGPSDRSLFEPFRLALGELESIHDEWRGPAYRFDDRGELQMPQGTNRPILIDAANSDLLTRHFPYTAEHLDSRSPVIGLVEDGAIVSACFSARRRPGAHEAGVATEVPYQGRGHGTAVVAAWRDAVEATGAQPLYSTSWDNAASRAIARRLGLITYAETFSLG
jgi:RimJ/RimL family protein N-acetyltransferase